MNATQFALLGFGPIATALTIFGLIVVRGTKVSEFRQAWVNDQRADLGKLLSAARHLATRPSSGAEAHWLAFEEAATRINLRENPEKNEWQEVLEAIVVLRRNLNPLTADPAFDMGASAAEIETEARRLLKGEWKRVRFGELGYKTLIVSAAVMVFWPVLPLIGYLLFRLFGLGAYLPQGLEASTLIPNATK